MRTYRGFCQSVRWLFNDDISTIGRRGSSISILTELRAGRPGFYSEHGQEFIFLHHRVQTSTGVHPASYPMGTVGSFPEGKESERQAYYSLPSSVAVKNMWSYSFTPSCVLMSWYLLKHRNNFTFTYQLQMSVWSNEVRWFMRWTVKHWPRRTEELIGLKGQRKTLSWKDWRKHWPGRTE